MQRAADSSPPFTPFAKRSIAGDCRVIPKSTRRRVAVVPSPIAAVGHDGERCPRTSRPSRSPPPSASGTWAILDRDGANRPMARYLSSLGGGESGTGVIISPPFRIATDTITFTICGHDGQGGGQKKNFIALVDAKTGKTLQQTTAPGSDAVQARSWDVAKLRPREVRH